MKKRKLSFFHIVTHTLRCLTLMWKLENDDIVDDDDEVCLQVISENWILMNATWSLVIDVRGPKKI